MKLFPSLIAAVAALASLHSTAHAHYIWATVADNSRVRFALLDDVREAPSAQFVKYVAALSPRTGSGKKLALGAPQDGARYAPLAPGQTVAVADSVVGAKERGGPPYLLVYHAKAATSLAAAGTEAKAAAELLARRDGGDLVVTLKQNGWPIPGSEVTVQWPGTEKPRTATTNLAGEARVAWAPAQAGGIVGVRAMATEPKSGADAGGAKYESVRHWATLTFPVGAAAAEAAAKVAASHSAPPAAGAAAAPPTEERFSRTLRASYAHNHEIVGNAAFNATLFEGKLTREQLEVHLQQRALVHNELHRILIGPGGAARRVPYGAAQKNVLTLLFGDLIAMGSGWPTEAQARPLTAAFLKEIRDSEAKGPFFALGVQHVYYGGITNGGRTIGEKIAETLGITLAYYAKSDGYPEYLPLVDRITDPEARAEMIRGGQAAYRYIIASSNEDVFRAKTAGK